MSDDPFPDVPADRLSIGGWTRVARTSETLLSIPALRVEGYTLLYEQPDLREAVRTVFERVDLPWRFFFATRLSFTPAPTRFGRSSLFPVVLTAARREFASDLRERGFEAVERGRTRRLHTDDGGRARLTGYDARFEADTIDADVAAWLAVWDREGRFRLAGGVYPTGGLDSAGVALDPERYREELFALIRGVR